MAMQTPIRIELTDDERSELERRARSHMVAHHIVVRAKVILQLAAGKTISSVSRSVDLERRIVRKWGTRFVRKRLAGLDDDPRSGRPGRFSPDRDCASGQARLRAA